MQGIRSNRDSRGYRVVLSTVRKEYVLNWDASLIRRLRKLGFPSQFVRSDSRGSNPLMLLGGLASRTGYNGRNIYRVVRAGTVCQALGLPKANGAGHTEGLSGADGERSAGLRVYQGNRRSI